MLTDIATKQDLELLRQQLVADFTTLLHKPDNEPQKEFLRAKEARKLLGGISNGSLQNLRVKGLLESSKIGGIFYYKRSGIMAMLNAGTKLE